MTILTPEDALRRRKAIGVTRRQLAGFARLSSSTIRRFEDFGQWSDGCTVSEAWREMLAAALTELESQVFAAMKPGDVVEIVRVPHGERAPAGFTHLPPSRPSHHDRFSSRAARKVAR